MTTIQQRNLLKEVYPSKLWTQKVDKMNDAQVTAIFLRLKSQGKINV